MAFSLSHLSTQTHAIYHIYASHNSLHIWHYTFHIYQHRHMPYTTSKHHAIYFTYGIYTFSHLSTQTPAIMPYTTEHIFHRHVPYTTEYIFHRPQTHAIMPYTTEHIFHRPAPYIFHFICKQGITPININTSHHMPFPTDI